MTLKLGVIGTGWISRTRLSMQHYQQSGITSAIYTRNWASGVTFTEDFHHVDVFENLTEFVGADLDVIYVASPNSLHFEQAKAAILAPVNTSSWKNPPFKSN